VNSKDNSGNVSVSLGLTAEFTYGIGIGGGYSLTFDIPTDPDEYLDIRGSAWVSGRSGYNIGYAGTLEFPETPTEIPNVLGGDIDLDLEVNATIGVNISTSVLEAQPNKEELPRAQVRSGVRYGPKFGASVGARATGTLSLRGLWESFKAAIRPNEDTETVSSRATSDLKTVDNSRTSARVNRNN
jgi:hypothetical protein